MVYVPPLGEEMNRCRRIAALQAKSMAMAGYAVLQLDLGGSGDSGGDFAHATWDVWVQDVLAAHGWMLEFLQQQAGGTALPRWFWALRGGCLLAVQAVRQLASQPIGQNEQAVNLLFWQPVASGSLYLTQWLRLQSASSLVQGKAGATTQALRQRLLAGEAVEIAGYQISPALASGLDAANLGGLPSGTQVLCWFASDAAVPAVPLAFANQLATWQAAGVQTQALAAPAPAFWQLQEVGDAPLLRANALDSFLKTGA